MDESSLMLHATSQRDASADRASKIGNRTITGRAYGQALGVVRGAARVLFRIVPKKYPYRSGPAVLVASESGVASLACVHSPPP